MPKPVNNEDQLRYPIGKFAPQDSYTAEEVRKNIDSIEALPVRIEAMVRTLSQKQLDTAYRDGGWTARQVIHHLSDSHMNAYIRFKWALTENTPTIKAYNEKAWAETPEIQEAPEISVNLLKALHTKMTALLRRIPSPELQKAFTHPETGKQVKLERMIALYAWHGEHHLGHLDIVSKK